MKQYNKIKVAITMFTLMFMLFGICKTDVYAAENKGKNVELTEEEESGSGSESESEDQPEVPDVEEDPEEETGDKYDAYFENVTFTENVVRAVGTGIQLKFSNLDLDKSVYQISYTSSDESKVTVDEHGYVKMKEEGTETIEAVVSCEDGSDYTYLCNVTITNPTFSEQNYFVTTNDSLQLIVDGTPTLDYTLKIYKNDIIKLVGKSNTKVKGLVKGKSKVSTTVDGKTISCYVYVSKPKLNYTDKYVVKGNSLQFKVTGHSKATDIKYTSSDTKVATISKTGKLKTKKNGSCIISITVDDQTLICYIGVSNKTVVNTINRAYKALGCTYSQPKRMSANYYDCSSLVWRSYSKYGVKFGNSSYAPTAAGQAYNMVKNKKAIYYKGVDEKKLLPGDVLFVKSAKNNGRYKNIGHVAIYIGNGRIIHATTPKVTLASYSRYLNNKSNPYVLIARPTK